VFGGGTFEQFSGFVKEDMSTKSYKQEGFDKMTQLWFRRVRPGETDMKAKGKGDGAPSGDDIAGPIESGGELGGVEDPRVEAATSAFHGINAAVNTVALWGRRTKEVAVSDNVMFALTDLGEIYAWGGNDHWWHEVEPDSHWQTHWRGDTTARSKMLLMTHNKQAPEEEEPDRQVSARLSWGPCASRTNSSSRRTRRTTSRPTSSSWWCSTTGTGGRRRERRTASRTSRAT
jgi:hypothetical protein